MFWYSGAPDSGRSSRRLEKYLEKIDVSDELSPSFEVLQKLQRQHLFSIPFENLDIHYRDRIELDIDKLYDKIINDNRGGFCYELNGLFYALLRSVGFDARMISARVHEGEEEYSPEFDHMAIIVRIDDSEYLVDVGFGEFIFSPLKIETGIEQHDLRATYRIESHSETYLRVSKKENGEWVPEYIFDPTARALEEFKPRCEFHQTSTESHFHHKKVCSRPIKNGRLTVAGDKVKIKRGDEIQEQELQNEEDFRAALWEHFRIEL